MAEPRAGDEDTAREPRVPRVSVGLPVYNGDAYLEQALASLLAQDFEDFELIISDNGSTDRTEAICRRAADRDARVRHVRHATNRGAAWNFNHVVTLARGEYFRWACHDDTCEPEHLGRLVEALDSAPSSVVLAYTRTILDDANGSPIAKSEDDLHTVGMSPHERFRELARRLRYANVLFGLIRRDALLKTGLIRPYESSDYVLLAELALLGEFVEVPAYLFRRRIHKGMSTRANPTSEGLARWFAPAAPGAPRLPHLRLMRAYAHAAWTVPPGLRERIWSTLALGAWLRRSARPLLKEGAALLGRSRRTTPLRKIAP